MRGSAERRLSMTSAESASGLPPVTRAMDLLDLFDDSGLAFPVNTQPTSHSSHGNTSQVPHAPTEDNSHPQEGHHGNRRHEESSPGKSMEDMQSSDPNSNEYKLLEDLTGTGSKGLIINSIQLLSEDDPQSKDLMQVLQELGPSVSTGPSPNSQGLSIASKQSTTDHKVAATKKCAQKTGHSKAAAKNRHPTLTNILLHGVEREELYGPIVPLKDIEFCPTGDADGSLLYIQNLHHASRSHDISADRTLAENQPTGLFLNESLNQFLNEAMEKSVSQMLNETVAPVSSSSPGKHGKHGKHQGKHQGKHRGKHGKHGKSGKDTTFAIESSERCSKELVEKKNLYIKSLESTVADTMERNKNLTCTNSILEKENALLQREVTYLKKVLHSESCLRDVLSHENSTTLEENIMEHEKLAEQKKMSMSCETKEVDLGCEELAENANVGLGCEKRAGACGDEDAVTAKKRMKSSPKDIDRGMCVHIGADGSLLSIHSCKNCFQIANSKRS